MGLFSYKIVLLIISIITLMVTMTLSCAPKSEFKKIQPLTDAEKRTFTETALGIRDVKDYLAGKKYTTDVRWLAINGYTQRDGYIIARRRLITDEEITKAGIIPNYSMKNPGSYTSEPIIAVYPVVIIRIGEPEYKQIRVAIIRETGGILFVENLAHDGGIDLTRDRQQNITFLFSLTSLVGRWSKPSQLTIEKDGMVTFIVVDVPPGIGSGGGDPPDGIKTTKTGQLGTNDLDRLVRLFEKVEFDEKNRYKGYSGEISVNISQIIYNQNGNIKMIGLYYDALAEDPGLMAGQGVSQAVVNAIDELKYIVEYRTKQISREPMAYPWQFYQKP